MKKRRVNPTAIGAFVLGAIVIAVASVILFGSGRWFGGDRVSFVCFFEDAVDGMQIGSKVKLKGVPIGEVTQILIRFPQTAGEEGVGRKPMIPVIIEVNLERLSNDLGVDMDFRDDALYHAQIQDGLRASLGSGNLITGVLQVDLDYVEDAKAPETLNPFTYRGQVYRVIPTLPSQWGKAANDVLSVVNNISEADFKGVVTGLTELLDKISEKLDQFEVKGMNEALEAFQERMESPKFDEALTAFSDAAEAVTDATASIEELAAEMKEQLGENAVGDAVASADETFQALTDAVDRFHDMMEDHASLPGELEGGLQDFRGMATEIKELAAYLKERPNALLFGRKDKDEEGEDGEEVARRPRRQPWKVRR